MSTEEMKQETPVETTGAGAQTLSEPTAEEVTEVIELVEQITQDLEKVTEEPPVVETSGIPSLPESTQTTEEVPQDLSERQALLLNAAKTGTSFQKQIIRSLEEFAGIVQPRRQMNPSAAAKAEYELLLAFKYLLDQSFEDFKAGWNTMLLYFAEHHGENNNSSNYSPFSEFNMLRYLDSWTKGREPAQAYAHLVHLIRSTRHSKGRQAAIASISIESIGPGYLTEDNRENLKKFYKV